MLVDSKKGNFISPKRNPALKCMLRQGYDQVLPHATDLQA